MTSKRHPLLCVYAFVVRHTRHSAAVSIRLFAPTARKVSERAHTRLSISTHRCSGEFSQRLHFDRRRERINVFCARMAGCVAMNTHTHTHNHELLAMSARKEAHCGFSHVNGNGMAEQRKNEMKQKIVVINPIPILHYKEIAQCNRCSILLLFLGFLCELPFQGSHILYV